MHVGSSKKRLTSLYLGMTIDSVILKRNLNSQRKEGVNNSNRFVQINQKSQHYRNMVLDWIYIRAVVKQCISLDIERASLKTLSTERKYW